MKDTWIFKNQGSWWKINKSWLCLLKCLSVMMDKTGTKRTEKSTGWVLKCILYEASFILAFLFYRKWYRLQLTDFGYVVRNMAFCIQHDIGRMLIFTICKCKYITGTVNIPVFQDGQVLFYFFKRLNKRLRLSPLILPIFCR